MSNIDKQALRQLATDAHELGIIKRYSKGLEAQRKFYAAATPLVIRALLDELEAKDKRIAELERSELQLIDERDNAEAALADMYQAATGERPEWSNMFGFADAVDAVEDRLATLESGQGQPVMFIDGDISQDDDDKLAAVILEFNEETETPAARMARIIRENPHPTNMCDMPTAGTGKGE